MIVTKMVQLVDLHWTIDDAINLIRVVQPLAKHAGYHVGLAGGVLNRGESLHDLDLIVMPLVETGCHLKGLWRAFQFYGVGDIDEITIGYPPERGRTIWRGHLGLKQIDFFVYERLPIVERIKRYWRRGMSLLHQTSRTVTRES